MEKKRIDVMIDLETCSRRENAALLSLALVEFDIDTFEELGSCEYGIDLKSCFLAGLHFDQDTQEWWMKQTPAARSAILALGNDPIERVVKDVYVRLKRLTYEYDRVVVWSNGSDFDFPKLEYLFRKFMGEEPPYQYNEKRDMRTLYKELNVDCSTVQRPQDKHSALGDCLWQIAVLKKAFGKQ